ncbi:MAG: tetratricopeptide repeat protein [Pyrinomonadaceae bacterium]|nr:tetratricopeptide repeat protein [Pyrinomonadaceae bacterium]
MQKLILTVILSFIFFISVHAQIPDTVIVLPFENASGKPEFNWVGESFADSVSDLLVEKEVKSSGLNVISNLERKLVQESLRIPLTNIPSLATSIRIAQRAKANILLYGTYKIVPQQNDIAASIEVEARIIKVNEGKFLVESFGDGSRKMLKIVLTDALANLQTVEAKVLVETLKQLGRNLTIVENDVIKVATKVPAKAFEAYIKGLLTPQNDLQKREGYFKNAMRLYAEAKADEGEEVSKTYADVALELGHFYLNQRKNQEAVNYFSQVISEVEKCNEDAKKVNKRAVCKDNEAAEATFYTGLIYWQQSNYEQALAVLSPLADDWKLTSVYNTLGAISVQAWRSEKKDTTKAARLNQGIDFLKTAFESAPDDLNIGFNYALALFLNENYNESRDVLLKITSENPKQKDGEIYFLLGKIFQKLGDSVKSKDADDNARRMLTDNNRYAKLEEDWKNARNDGLVLRVEQPPRDKFVSVVLSKTKITTTDERPIDETSALLQKAKDFMKAGKDDEATQILRRILASDPINAEVYLLRGKIYLNQANLDEASNQLKTALFYDNGLIEAHVFLAKIFLEKKDCLQAKSYVASALAIDENNQDALGMQRQVERCSK